jgi:hypothetical protein
MYVYQSNIFIQSYHQQIFYMHIHILVYVWEHSRTWKERRSPNNAAIQHVPQSVWTPHTKKRYLVTISRAWGVCIRCFVGRLPHVYFGTIRRVLFIQDFWCDEVGGPANSLPHMYLCMYVCMHVCMYVWGLCLHFFCWRFDLGHVLLLLPFTSLCLIRIRHEAFEICACMYVCTYVCLHIFVALTSECVCVYVCVHTWVWIAGVCYVRTCVTEQ